LLELELELVTTLLELELELVTGETGVVALLLLLLEDEEAEAVGQKLTRLVTVLIEAAPVRVELAQTALETVVVP